MSKTITLKSVLAFLCCLLLIAESHAQTYEKITSDARSSLYLVKGSVDRTGKGGANFPSVTVLLDFPTGLPTSAGVAASVTIDMFLDCSLGRQIITQKTFHGGGMGAGKTVMVVYEPSNNDVRAGFLMVYKRLC
jgi:hypothetical protein